MNIRTYGQKALTSVVTTTTILWSMGFASLAPLAAHSAVSLNAGDLIRGDATPAVYYYGGDGKRYVFPNEKTYKTWYSDFSSVKRISDADLQAIPLASSNITYRPGTKLVKVTTDPKVYAVDKGGALRWVKTEAVAVALLGADWAKSVEDLPDAFYANYSTGADVAAVSDYNVSTVQSASPTIASDKGISGGVVVTGALSVALGSDTPTAASVANSSADVVFSKLTFTGTGTITGMKVKRTGLSADSRLTGVKLFDGTSQVGTTQTLNSQHKAVFTGLSIVVNGSKTLVLAGDVLAAGGAGEIVKLGLEAAGDVTLSGGASPSGTFPIEGAGQTITSVTIGSATLANGPQHPTSDTNVDSDAVDYRFTQVRLTAGSTEDAVIKQIVAVRSGTAADSDVKNIKLVNDTAGTTLATAAALGAGSKATFDNLNVVVKKGEFVDLSVKATVTGSGSSRTIGFELHDGVAYTVRVVGALYGFGITPTRSNFCATAGVTGGACPTQTIKLGTLDIARSAQSPAASNVALGGTLVPLAAFDFTVTGEPVRVTQMKLRVTPATASSNEITNIGFYDASGNVVAGPKDGATATVSTAEDHTYTDSLTLPVGSTTLWVKANLATAMSGGDTVLLTLLDPSTNMTVKGDQSGKSITARTSTNVTGNTQTIQGPALKVVTTGLPKAGNIVAGVQDFAFAVVDLDPSGSGEDVKITEVKVLNGGTGTVTDITNLEVWGDPDNTDSKEVVERIQTTNSTSQGAATNTFTFSTPLRVGKAKTSRLYIKGDVLSSATATTTHLLRVTNVAANVTSTGWTTGTSITATFSGAGQTQTIVASGSLKVEISSARPNQTQFVAGTSGNTFVQYKLTASNESINVRRIPVALAVNAAIPTATNPSLGKVWAFVSDTETGTQTALGDTAGYSIDADGKALINLDSSPWTVVKDQSRFLTLKGSLNAKEDLTSGQRLALGIGDDDSNASVWAASAGAAAAGSYNVVAVGKDSGSTVTATNIDSVGDGSGNIQAGFDMFVYDGLLTVTKSASQPVASAGTADLLNFDITATGDTINVKDLEFAFSTTCTVTGTGDATLKANDGSNRTYVTWEGSSYNPFALGATVRSFKILGTQNGTVRGAGGFDTGQVLSVGAGQTLPLKLRGDVTGCTTNNSLQVKVDRGVDGTRTGTAPDASLTSGVSWNDVELTATNAVDNALTKNLPILGNNYIF